MFVCQVSEQVNYYSQRWVLFLSGINFVDYSPENTQISDVSDRGQPWAPFNNALTDPGHISFLFLPKSFYWSFDHEYTINQVKRVHEYSMTALQGLKPAKRQEIKVKKQRTMLLSSIEKLLKTPVYHLSHLSH